MEQNERLNDVFVNVNNSDNDVIIRVLNTFLEKPENSENVIQNMLYFKSLFEDLIKDNNIDRPNIVYIIDKMNEFEKNDSFENYVSILNNIHKQNMTDYKYLWMMCFLRAVFELCFEHHIYYKTPKYATMIATGENPWSVFLESFDTNDYQFLTP